MEEEGGGGSEIPKDDIIAYGKHILPSLFFFVVAILCIPGWIMCCFCCCCNCCCCCCCKKPCCKIPCFIITYALYALVVGVCFYGLSQSNHIFIGIADTECSILRFFDEILNGEIKTQPPKWAGIEGIKDILKDLNSQIKGMGSETADDLARELENINIQKGKFLHLMNSIGDKFFDSNGKYISAYSNNYNYNFGTPNFEPNGDYVLDLVKMFGKYDSTNKKFVPPNSTLDAWEFEYKTVSQIADEYMSQANESFSDILVKNIDDITGTLEEGQSTLDEIKGTIGDIKATISDIIIDNSGIIDEYGKLGVKIVFGVLALINVAIAVFMLLLCFCSGKCCTKCCCCRCLCKLFTHILWNVLALLMIIVFIVGSLLTLIGRVGSDVMNLISFVISDDNLGENGEGVLIDYLENVKNYTTRCIGGDGKIEEEIGLNLSDINSLDSIKEAEEKIEASKKQFYEKKEFVTYNIYKSMLEERVGLNCDSLSLLPAYDETIDFSRALPLKISMEIMNAEIQNTVYRDKEKWSFECSLDDKCKEGLDDEITNINNCFNPNSCKPLERDWIENNVITNVNIKGNAEIITNIINFINYAKIDSKSDARQVPEYDPYTEPLDTHYLEILNDLKDAYNLYLEQYITSLTQFDLSIKKITSRIKKYTGNNGIFSFANCNFIGTNLKIILKYLKLVLGTDIYTIGVCLILVGCSLILSISFTILLIIVINADIMVETAAIANGARIIAAPLISMSNNGAKI